MAYVKIHPSSVVDRGAEIGEGTVIWHFCHISTGSKIGTNCSLGQNVFVAPNVKVGNGVKIQNNVSLFSGVEIEDNVFLGPSCVFTNILIQSESSLISKPCLSANLLITCVLLLSQLLKCSYKY